MDDGSNFGIYDHDNNLILSLRNGVTPKIHDDISLALAVHSQEYSIQKADNIELRNNSFYWKDQFGIVHIHVDIIGEITWGTLLATIPVGFMPKYVMSFPAYVFTPGDPSSLSIGSVEIGPSGLLYGYNSQITGKIIMVSDLIYPADD